MKRDAESGFVLSKQVKVTEVVLAGSAVVLAVVAGNDEEPNVVGADGLWMRRHDAEQLRDLLDTALGERAPF